MGELTINIRCDLGDGLFNIELEADVNGDDIQSALEFDPQFQELLSALGIRFTELVVELEAL